MSYLPNLDQLPPEIRASQAAVIWNFETRHGKTVKVPYSPHWPNQRASVTDPTTWGSFDEAFAVVESGKADGVGIIIKAPLIGIDLDRCRNPETGEITANGWGKIHKVKSYTEVSVSRTGVHILAYGTLPPVGRRTDGLEIYDSARYFIVTGAHVDGTPNTIQERTPQLAELHAEYFTPASSSRSSSSSSPSGQITSLDDAALLVLARDASNGAAFTALWNGDTSAHGHDESAADLALLNHLAFWTACDAETMDRLFRQSGLMRPKWDSRRRDTTYGAISISRAIRDCTETYEPAHDIEINDSPALAAEPLSDPDPEFSTPEREWLVLHPDALIGLFGDVVRALLPVTEADAVALLLHALVLFGSLLARAPHMRIGRDLHHLNENVLFVGETGTGRKGMALSDIRHVMVDVDPVWGESCLQTGLSSGEGLIHAVRDPTSKQEAIKVDGRVIRYETVTIDAGVSDKRLCCVESEFAKVLRVSRRDGSTLSAVLRQAWDSGDLRVLTRQSPVRATNAHVSVIGHITPRELRQELQSADLANGFMNRLPGNAEERLPSGASGHGRIRDRGRQ